MLGFWIDVDAVDQSDALDDVVGVIRVLAAHKFDALAVALVEYCVVKQYIPPGTTCELVSYLLPELTGRKAIGFEEV